MFTKKEQAETLLIDKPSGDNRPVAMETKENPKTPKPLFDIN